jgi:hypothetical protein
MESIGFLLDDTNYVIESLRHAVGDVASPSAIGSPDDRIALAR